MTPARSQPLLAAAWMTGAIVSFTAMAIAGRAVSVRHDTFETMLFRSLTGILIVLLIMAVTGRGAEIRAQRLGLHTVRNLFHFSGQNLWFWALTAIPLAQLFALEFTAPIWVALLGPLFLSERLTAARLGTAALGFVGILIVARPDPSDLSLGVLAGAAAAVCFAFTAIFTKKLTRTEPILSILFWLTVIQACFGLIAAGWDGDIALPTVATLPWLILIGCGGLLAHFCLTTALSLAPASVVMPIDFARLPVIALIGMLYYSEPLEPAVLLGAAVIFAANYLSIRREARIAATF